MKYLIKPAIAVLAAFATFCVAAAEHNLLIQTNAHEGDALFKLEQAWLDKMEKESNGQVSFDLVGEGSAVGYTETLDAMRLGVIDGHFTSLGFFADKDPGIALLSQTVGAWSNADEFLRFMYEGGGNELLKKFYADYGVHYIGSLTTGLEAFVSKVPVNSVADLEGLKVRVPDGMVFRVFAAAGAKPVNLPSSQVTNALKNGTIDATDYSVFSINQSLGMNDIAPNPVYPGFHSMQALDFSITKEKWDKLPADVQKLLSDSILNFAREMVAYFEEQDQRAVAEAERNPNITIHNWSPEERKKFRTIAQRVWKSVSEESPMANQSYQLIVHFLEQNNLL